MRSTFAWDMERVSGTSKQYTGKPSLSMLSPPRIPLLGPRAPPDLCDRSAETQTLRRFWRVIPLSFPDDFGGVCWRDGDFATGISATCDRYASEHRQRRPAPGGDRPHRGRGPGFPGLIS